MPTAMTSRFRLVRLWSAIALAVALCAGSAAQASASSYYISLGDSLSVGRQPDANGHSRSTTDGYVEVVARGLARQVGTVSVIKLGCGGTTATALRGSPCNRAYGSGSQVEQAEGFLAGHRRHTALVTVGIGDNDVEGCLSSHGISRGCFDSHLATMRRNLTTIASRLKKAAGSSVPVIGMSDYDQFLSYWLLGGQPRRIAVASVRFVEKLNATMDAVYRAQGAGAADASARFATRNLHTYVSSPYGRVPLAVARICEWTWSCDSPPRGPNSHAKHTGYRAIGLAILDTLAQIRQDPSGGAGGP